MYLEPSDEKLSLRDIRSRFLAALDYFAPLIRQTLKDEILPEFRLASKSAGFRKRVVLIIENESLAETLSEGDYVLAGFLDRLSEWQGRWHLYTHWLQSAALYTLSQMADFPDVELDCLRMPGQAFWPPDDLKARCNFEIRSWNPLGPLSENQHERSEIERLKEELKSMNDANLESYQRSGWKRVPKPIPDAHFEWLIDVQINGLGPTKIAKRNLGIRRRTIANEKALEREAEKIKKAIERLSKSIGLHRRRLKKKE